MNDIPNVEQHRATGKTLAVLCPVYNEMVVIPLFFDRIQPVIAALSTTYRVQLVFMNNCSSDGSLKVIKQIMREHSFVYVITMSRNVGYQRSIERGLQSINADLYTIIDVDCEDPPEMIADFVKLYEAGNEVVYGQRVDRDEPALIKHCRHLFYRVLRAFADEDIILDMAEFSLFTARVRSAILDENTSFPFLRASIARVGFRRAAIPFKRSKRIAGKSHYNLLSMSLFAVSGVLASSTLLLRVPIYVFPFWIMTLILLSIAYAMTGSLWFQAFNLLAVASYLGATAAVTALYVARTYKNGLIRPNAFTDHVLSFIPSTADTPGEESEAARREFCAAPATTVCYASR